MQLKQYEIVTDADKLTVDIQSVCMARKTIKKWAYILHDKDDTRPHYHIYVNFGNAGVPHEDVASWFGVPENMVSKILGRRTDALLYLTHSNDSQQNKHRYSPKEIVSNFDVASETAVARIIGDFEHYSYAQQLAFVDSLPRDEKSAAFSKLKKLWELHCQSQILKPDRELSVIFVTGKAGAGKTTYSKMLLEKLNMDYAVSSSSNDPFQDYMGQKAMLLDDLRWRDFALSDILKMLDNNTNSSIRSRFNNKVFNGELIVITCSIPLKYWYRLDAGIEDLKQLYRRIGTYIVVDTHEITVYDGVSEKGEPAGNYTVYVNDIPKRKEESKPKLDIRSAFGQIATRIADNPICTPIPTDLVQEIMDVGDTGKKNK